MKKPMVVLAVMILLGIFVQLRTGSCAYAKVTDVEVYSGEGAGGIQLLSPDQIPDEDYFFVGDYGRIKAYWYSGWGEEITDIPFTYVSDQPNIVRVDASGNYQVMGPGAARVTVTGTDSNTQKSFYAQCVFYCGADVSDVRLDTAVADTYLVNGTPLEKTVTFFHMPDMTYSVANYEVLDPNMSVSLEFDKQNKVLKIQSWTEGYTTVTITINNKEFILTVRTTNVTINKSSAVIAKKKKTKLKVSGYSGKVTWKSTKKKNASVSSKGVVKGKKVGNAVIYAEIEGSRIGCAVSVVTAKRKKVITKAKNIAKGTYSQAKRMSKGYYDCSSLVWRAYQKEGKSLGNKNYAPVAADLCKWCISHNKRIKGGLNNANIQNMKLRPGDLLFETGANNGRYKGVYHVEMFVGYECEGFDASGKPILGTLWAARGTNYYFGGIMGRP